MFKKLAVGLQAVCLCVVVGFFATEMMDNAKGIVGGWCIGDSGTPSGRLTNPPCHSSTNDLCSGVSGCALRASSCNGGSGGGGGCTNTSSPACDTDDRCVKRKACTCSAGY